MKYDDLVVRGGNAALLCSANATLMITGSLKHGPLADFCTIFPHHTVALMFGTVFGVAMPVLGIGVTRFW